MSWLEIFRSEAEKRNAEYARRHRAKMRELRKANAI